MLLITGAGGTVGSALVDEFKKSKQPMRLAFRSAEKAAQARAAGYEALTLDFDQPDTLAPALVGVERVFLLSNGVVGQAEGEINLVDAARKAGVAQIVKLSVWRAEREAYALAALHRRVERAIEQSGMGWTFLRPNNFMQNFLGAEAATIRAEGAFYLPAGTARISHIDVRDIARVAVQALTEPGHAGKAYTLSGPEAFSYDQAAETLALALGRPLRYVPIADDALHGALLADGAPPQLAETLVDLYQYFRRGDADGVTSDVRDVTGREPIPFAQFAREYAAAFL